MLFARIFTLYPEFFPGPLGKGLYGKALAEKIWKLETINIRDYATDKHKTVDDTTYGGGSGMLIKPDVLANSLDKNLKTKEKIIYLSPRGKLFNQEMAKKISLTYKQFIKLKKYCQNKKIKFLSTPFDLQSIDRLDL